MSTNRKLAVVSRTTLPPQRDYADFDQWVTMLDRMNVFWQELFFAAPDEDGQKLVKQFTREQLVEALGKIKAGHDWYSRDELFDGERKFVSDQVALLLGSFPNAVPHSPEVYTRMLIEEICNAKPHPCELESACRRIRRTMKFPPSSAEVLEVLEEEGSQWIGRWELFETGDDLDPRILVYYDKLVKAIAQAKGPRE